MRTLVLVALAAVLSVVPGCGPTTSTLKGKVVNGADPVKPDGQLVSLSFYPLAADGKPGKDCYTSPLQADGTFQFVASGGRLPPGKYRVVIAAAQAGPPTPGKADKAKPPTDRFAGYSTVDQSRLEISVEPGDNDVVVDVAKAK